MNSLNFCCEKCKKILKYDDVNKIRFCANCNPDYFKKFKNDQRIRKRIKDCRSFIGVEDAGDIVFLNIDDSNHKCELQFRANMSNQFDIIKERKNWIDKTIRTTAKINMFHSDSNLIISIKGWGNDNRCTWCKSFRTSLTGYLNIEYQKRCPFA